MSERATRQNANHHCNLAAFAAENARFDALLAGLQRMSGDHLGADQDKVLWGFVGELQHCKGLLGPVTDVYFRCGERAR